jgi:hypothetical protein
MPNWKKVIVSGSDAALNSLNVTSLLSVTGSSNLTGSLNISGSASILGNTGTTTFYTNADTLIFTGSVFISGSIIQTGSLNVTSITSSLFGTASWANNAISSSYALTASYALNGGGGGGGGAFTYHQTASAVTWSVSHSLNTYTPIVQVYDDNYNVIIPASISGSSTNTIQITFSTAETGYAVLSTGGSVTVNISGSNATLVQATPATTWSFYHGLNETYPVFTIFDNNDDVIVPLKIHADNANTASIYFTTARTGTAVAANCGLSGSTFESASYATTASYALTSNTSTLQQVVNTGNGIANFGGNGTASIQSTNFTNNRTLYLNDNSFPTIRLVDNLNASNNLQIDIATLSLNGTSYNWSDIVSSTSSYALTASFVTLAQTASYVLNAVSASFAQNASTASYIVLAQTASFVTLAQTSSFVTTAQTASYVLNAVSASYASQALSSSYALTASYADNIVVSGSISNVDYIDFDTSSAVPAWKSGRVFWDNTDGCLGVYNAEADVTLNVGQENWTRVRNNTGTTITNGTVVRIIGAQGDVPTVERAQSIAKSGSINFDTQILGVATHNIEDNSFGYITTQGLVRGLNTNAFNDGDSLFVGTGSAGALQNTAPRAPYEIIPVGVCVKASPGGSGIIYVAVQQPLDFSDLSSVLVQGTYSHGDLWTYVPSGSFGVWTHTNQLSGSYGVTGSVSATSLTGSLRVTGNSTYSGSQTVTTGYVVLTQVSQSLNYADDAAAASGGVPLGGLYRNGNFIAIRIV